MNNYINNHPRDSLGDRTHLEFRQYFQCTQLTQFTGQQIAHSENIETNYNKINMNKLI